MDAETRTPLPPGLYLVGTPIGNLQDITLRALETLKSCHLLAAEDTRHTRKLLNHFGIETRAISYREENHATASATIIKTIQSGKCVALVTDAGMPAISDPGVALVNDCLAAGLNVDVIPGASAAVTAAARSGMTARGFVFAGFPPSRSGPRKSYLADHQLADMPLVIYEAPHRIIACLQDALEILGDRPAMLGREMTKMHQEWLGPTLSAILETLERGGKVIGEIALVIGPAAETSQGEYSEEELRKIYSEMLTAGLNPKEALKAIMVQTGLKRSYLYDLLRKEE